MAPEKGNTKDTAIAGLLAVLILLLIIPILFKNYVLPPYYFAWYWSKLYTFDALWSLCKTPFFRHNYDNIFIWVDWFIWDMDLKGQDLVNMVRHSYQVLLTVDTTSMHTIMDSIVDKESKITDTFSVIGRLHYAHIGPIYVSICLIIARILYKTPEFNTVFTLDSFATTMAEGFPELLPVVYVNPQKWGDLDSGPWRMSPKVYKYMEENGCLDVYNKSGKTFFRIKERETTELLIEQLGEKWAGFDDMPQNYRRIAATAIPMVISPSRGRDKTNKLIEQFAYAFSSKPAFITSVIAVFKSIISPQTYFSVKGIKALFKNISYLPTSVSESIRQRRSLKKGDKMVEDILTKYGEHKLVKKTITNHAYQLCVVASLIEAARKGGVFASCSSLWLKVHDRKLFYVFNNLGRQVSWIEVAGFWSHYIAEKRTEAPFPYPKVRNGLEGIDEYFYSSYYTYEPLMEYDDA